MIYTPHSPTLSQPATTANYLSSYSQTSTPNSQYECNHTVYPETELVPMSDTMQNAAALDIPQKTTTTRARIRIDKKNVAKAVLLKSAHSICQPICQHNLSHQQTEAILLLLPDTATYVLYVMYEELTVLPATGKRSDLAASLVNMK